MQILMVAPEPVLEPRGTPISIYQRCQALTTLGHRIDLVTYHLGHDVQLPGLTVRRTRPLRLIREIGVGPSWQKLLLDVLIAGKTLEALLSRPYDVIHSHEEAAILCWPLARLFRTPHLYDMHSSLPAQLARSRFGRLPALVGLFEWLETRVLRSVDAVITIGADLAEQVRRINPTVPNVMIENLPVDDPSNDPSGDRDRSNGRLAARLQLNGTFPVVYTGTLEHYQGIELLIAAAEILRQQAPNVVFVVVGGKPQQVEHWRQVARARGVDGMMRFTGIVPIDAVGWYTRQAQALVSPRIEGMSVPLKIYSYLRAGKPIIATDIACHRMVLNDESALLVPPTGEALARGIRTLARDPALSDRLAKRGRAIADQRSDRAAYQEKLVEIYRLFGHSAEAAGRPGASPAA